MAQPLKDCTGTHGNMLGREEEQRSAREDVTHGGDGRTEKRQKAQHGCDRQDGIRVTGLLPRLNSKCQISQ